MSDIFISYASEDRAHAKKLAQALGARGWSVWWDRDIPTGRAFDEVIEKAIEWVQDCWNDSYVGAPTDGSAWTAGDCARRVIRGGHWVMGRGGGYSAQRDEGERTVPGSARGFRVVRMLR